MAKEIEVRKVKVDTDEAVDHLAELQEAIEEVKDVTADLEDQLEDMPGPLSEVQSGIKKVNKAFKAMLANPIVALIALIVLGLVTLFKAFQKTSEGAAKTQETMKAISAVIDVLVDRAAKLFKALGKLFKGDFRGAAEDAKAAVSGVKDEMIEATRAAVELAKATRAVYLAETELIKVSAERRKQISELRFLSRDLTLSYQERITALEKATAVEVEGLKESVALQQAKVDLLNQELATTPEALRSDEQKRMLAEANVALLEMQTASIEQQKGLLDEVNALRAEQKSATDAAISEEQAKAAEVEKARLEKYKSEAAARKEQAELDRQFDEDMAAEELALEEEIAAQIKAIDAATTAAAITNIEKQLAAAEKAAADQIMWENQIKNVKAKIYEDSLFALVTFLGEGSKLAKGIMISDAVKSAIQGAINTYTSVSAIPIAGPLLAPIAAGAALAAGMANVKKIASTPSPLGGSGGSVPSVSLSRPSTAIDSRNLVNADQSIPGQVEITQDSSQRGPTKTYVVQSEMTAAQDIERERQREATL